MRIFNIGDKLILSNTESGIYGTNRILKIGEVVTVKTVTNCGVYTFEEFNGTWINVEKNFDSLREYKLERILKDVL